MRSSLLPLAISAFASVGAALDPVEVYGNKFFNKDGSQFFMKGVAYQLRPTDPFVDTDQCKRDASLMKELGVNTIRTYHVDPNGSHDGCMKAFDDAGIYVLLDLDTFETYINSTHLQWDQGQYDAYAKVMDKFHGYNNVLGFFIANEGIAARGQSQVAPYLKAAARDMKAYRDNKGYRKIPIGYSAAHIVEMQPMLQDFLTCGGDDKNIIDFYAINSYSWCDPSTYENSAYDKLQKYAQDFPVPIFFSETGCNTHPPRLFGDQDAIFGKEMINDISGALIYEWIEETNNYGLVTYGKADSGPDVEEGFVRKGTPTPVVPDFENLKSKWATIKPTGVKKADYTPKPSTRPCPSSTDGGWWQVPGNVKLPTIGQAFTGSYSTAAPSPTGSSTGKTGGNDSGSPSKTQGSGDAGKDGKDGKGDKSAAIRDKQITVAGSALSALVLGAALLL